jgi:hypothetical protein
VARYRKIDPRIWNDTKFCALSPDGKLVFLFLLTHVQLTAIGAMRGTIPGLAAELDFPERRFRAAIEPAIQAGMVEVNEGAHYIGLPKFLKYNEPEGPNSVKKAWAAALELIPECPERVALIRRCRNYLDTCTQEFKKALADDIWKAFAIPSDMASEMASRMPSGMATRIQEQEQELELEQELEKEQKEPPHIPLAGGFDRFWNSYPRKTAKAAAEKAWRKIEADESLLQTIISAIEQQRKSHEWTKDNGQYVPHPATWLNGRRWEDQVNIGNNSRGSYHKVEAEEGKYAAKYGG